MTIASYQTIKRLAPLSPLCERTKAFGLTYGLSGAGYDIRLAERVVLGFGPDSFCLASSMERFHMPSNLLGIVHDKSTLARLGLAVQNTVIEPGWQGYLTLELTNHGRAILALEAGQPIAQIIFHLLDEPTQVPYSGKYQNQAAGPQQAILEP